MVIPKQRRLRVEALEDRCLLSANVVLEWNQLALAAIGQARINPIVASRALAITQAAVYDAVNAIDRSFEPYHADVQASHGASLKAAAAQAAHDSLAALIPSQAGTFDAALAADLVGIPPGLAKQGIDVGHEVARQILEWRSTDGSDATVSYTPGTNPGDWQPTPPAFLPAVTPQWPYVTPFAMTSGSQFRPAGPPALTSPEYTAAFNEVKELGRADSTIRSAEETEIARFWSEAVTPASAVGHWNQIVADLSVARGLTLSENARLFALLNLGMADGVIAFLDCKYTYNFWRPVTAIRAADTDGNPDTEPDPTWTPLVVAPPHPGYAGAHATLSAAATTVLARFFGTDIITFSANSDNLPGVTRWYSSFSAAANEAGRGRVLGGIQWTFGNRDGLSAGRALGNYVMDGFLKPRDDGDDQLRAVAAATAPVHQSLRGRQVQPLLTQALHRWEAAGVDTTNLQGIDIRIADLGGLTLGRAADGVIWLDDNAAGWGWFVDRTPGSDREFARRGNQGEKNRMDLLTVLEHEVGHLLGYEHELGGLMQETLNAGTRVTVGPGAAKPGDEATLISWTPDSPVIDGLVTGKRK